MTDVNKVPFSLIPESWAFHPTKGPFIRDLLEVINGNRERSGGDSDTVLETVSRDVYDGTSWAAAVAGLQREIACLKDELEYSRALTTISHFLEIPVSGGTHYAADRTFIVAKNRAGIVFPPSGNFFVRNSDGSAITLDGNGKLINGSTNGKITLEGTTIEFYYLATEDIWCAR